MTFPESDAIKGAISSLKEIVSRSQSENSEGVKVLSQIEATLLDIEVKARSAGKQSFVPSVVPAAPVVTL